MNKKIIILLGLLLIAGCTDFCIMTDDITIKNNTMKATQFNVKFSGCDSIGVVSEPISVEDFKVNIKNISEINSFTVNLTNTTKTTNTTEVKP